MLTPSGYGLIFLRSHQLLARLDIGFFPHGLVSHWPSNAHIVNTLPQRTELGLYGGRMGVAVPGASTPGTHFDYGRTLLRFAPTNSRPVNHLRSASQPCPPPPLLAFSQVCACGRSSAGVSHGSNGGQLSTLAQMN